MSILIDTNVLLRAAQVNHPQYQTAVDAVALLRQTGEEVCLVAQDLYEFWTAATRPINVNGLGWPVSQAESEIQRLKSIYLIHDDIPAIYPEWERLVVKYQVVGKNAH